ncbi:uncharacterized protein BXZ73DRAFT_82000 [Epithele typhae]|uniref:uncharacterized protein n=1 Tax=Epithele typhae TaxID=378194 RepID=UPI0020088F81|nr:uncharacterized protein BXZ73DRAFT_82000 [Epithele typhae]KAH9913152.1 hypothetical protein BXZ73DRAFT_82000 [Epithele typhae]
MTADDLGDTAAEVIQEIQELYSGDYVGLATAIRWVSEYFQAILIFDYILTSGREIELFWKRRVSGATILFICNRYLSLVSQILTLISYRAFTDKVIPPAAFSAMRALALSKSRPLAILVFLLSIVNVGFDFGTFQYQTGSVSDPVWGCLVDDVPFSQALLISGEVLSRSLLILADGILIFLTWKTLRPAGTTGDYRGVVYFPQTFAHIMLHNAPPPGHIIELDNIPQGTSIIAISATRKSKGGATSHRRAQTSRLVHASLTAIFVSRFLLDLQEAHQRTVKVASDDPLRSSASDFRVGIGSLRVAVDAIGSLGADLRILGEEGERGGEVDSPAPGAGADSWETREDVGREE